MDTSVALVQAYLHLNGYFTVAEYPVLEAYADGARTVTDLDILAFRFADAGHPVIRSRRRRTLGDRSPATDPLLRCPSDRPDMIVGGEQSIRRERRRGEGRRRAVQSCHAQPCSTASGAGAVWMLPTRP